MSAVPLEPVEPRRLYRQIAQQLARLIGNGDYAAGSRLPAERELAGQLGVSRPTVREALIALEVEGVVEVRGGSGVFVRAARTRGARGGVAPAPQPGPFDVLRARWIVESEAAALAATHATAAQLAGLKATLKEMQRARTHSPQATAADQRFHLGIAEASGNAALLQLVQQLWRMRTGELYTQLESHFVGETIWRQAVAEHGALLDAIAARNPAAARRAMRRHTKNAELRFASAWKADPK